MAPRLPRLFEDLRGLRARGLIRESTEEQGERSGPIVQQREEQAFATRWELSGPDRFYTDFQSGSDARKRPQFLQMVQDAKAGLFDVLLVYDTSRLSRNWRQAGFYEDELHTAGVCVAYLHEGQLSSGPGQLQVVVNHALNQDWLDKHKVKVKLGYRVHRFERGKYSGMAPLGYLMEYESRYNPTKRAEEPVETGRLVPDHEPQPRIGYGDLYSRADLVRLIGRRYASGLYGARTLAAYLNRQGYRNKEGRPFTDSALRVIVGNPTYSGLLAWNRKKKRLDGEELELVEGSHEPLWSPELWAQMNAVRQRQRTGSPGGRRRHAYPFRGLVTCDRCDAKMFGEPHRLHAYMACPTQRGRHGCEQKAVRSSTLEGQVETWLRTLRVPADWRDDIERMQRRITTEVRTTPKVDTKRIEAQLANLRELFVIGDVTREEYVGRKHELEASLDSGSGQPSYAEAVLVQAARLLNNLGELWARSTADERTEIAQNLFANVRVRDGVIVAAKLARDEYLPLIASVEARVWMARPEGFEPPTY
jgi:DNA invertase Pin-like site-specific DNA recombinase